MEIVMSVIVEIVINVNENVLNIGQNPTFQQITVIIAMNVMKIGNLNASVLLDIVEYALKKKKILQLSTKKCVDFRRINLGHV
jgi:hypothetical protein